MLGVYEILPSTRGFGEGNQIDGVRIR
jgi:hypothetical protein